MSALRVRRSSVWVVLALLLAALLAAAGPTRPAVAAPTKPSGRPYASCAAAAPAGYVRCMSIWRPTHTVGRQRLAAEGPPRPPSGIHPADIRKAYKLPKKGKKKQTIAIVDAYDNPNVEQDLAVYRAAFGLPACTADNGCFRKVDQRGGTRYPEGDPGWGTEIDLDVQAVSASCGTCSILLVEADDPSGPAIGAAVNTAVRLGANVVSNSYGIDEYNGMLDDAARYYTHPGVAIVASSGDFGFTAAEFPAVLSTTWAVGGTTLKKTKHHHWTEDAWEGAGSGCSAYVAKPKVQKDKHCAMRTVADVSAVADPDNEFSVYDTYGLGEFNGWLAFGGTSLSAPLISGMIGLAGNASKVASPAYLYTHRKGLRDVRGGSNGYCEDYLCTAVKGYDGPTGLGSPRRLKSL